MRRLLRLCILLFSGICILAGCMQKFDANATNDGNDNQKIQAFEFGENRFKRVAGWLSDRSVLVHIGTPGNEQLITYDIFSAERRVVHDSPENIRSVQLSENSQYIAVQSLVDNHSVVKILDVTGQQVQQMSLDTTHTVSFQWNPEIESKLFVSYPKYSEGDSRTTIISWDAVISEVEAFEGNTLNPTWYSMHTYLYIKPKDIQRNSGGALYYGDITTKSDLLINSRIGHFYLNEDTFVAMTTSDFNKDEIFLTKEYPLMVDEGYTTLPKATLNDEVIYPFLTQGNRDGAIYAIVPKTPVNLYERAGKFELVVLDFETDTKKAIMDVPEYSPINISDKNNYLLYGWNYEHVIDLRQKEIYSFLKEDG